MTKVNETPGEPSGDLRQPSPRLVAPRQRLTDGGVRGLGSVPVTRGKELDVAERIAVKAVARVSPDGPTVAYRTLDIAMDDVVVQLHAPKGAAAFVADRYPLLGAATGRGPDVEVTLAMSQYARPLNGVGGRRVIQSANTVWCRGVPGLPVLTLGVRRGPPLGLFVELARSPLYRLYKRLVAGVTPERTYEILVAYAVLYPALLLAELRGRWPLHAAAVVRDRRVMLLLGLPGAGKSTISAALRDRGFELVSDNLVTVSPEGVWPVPEPLKLDDRSQELTGQRDTGGPVLPSTYGRTAQRIVPPHGPLPLAATVILQPGETTSLEATVHPSPRHLLDLNALAFELHAYDHVRAIMRLALAHEPAPGPEDVLRASLSGSTMAVVTVGRDQIGESCDILEGLM